MTRARTNLLGLVPDDLHSVAVEHFRERGEPEYRARQLAEWIQGGSACSFAQMRNLPRRERDALDERFRLEEPREHTVSESVDGTVKHLWSLGDGEVVESVLIPSGRRLTLCISSQAGCALACRFCATGWSGFGRQLSTAEIVGQYRASARWAATRELGTITNIVFMGMGEPLANRKAVLPALTVLNSGYGVGARRITVSTVGVVPGIAALAARPEQFRLALSLHAPVSSLRADLIPLERRYPLDELIVALEEFNRSGGRRVTFEYTMIRGVNDEVSLIRPLAELALRVAAFVNLIPFNPIPYTEWRPSAPQRVRAFRDGLREAGVAAEARAPRGRDIDAACGQLRAAKVGRPDKAVEVRPRAAERGGGDAAT